MSADGVPAGSSADGVPAGSSGGGGRARLSRVRLCGGLLLVAGVGWALATAWGAVLHSHLAYPAVLVVTIVVAAFLAAGRPAPGRLRWLRYAAAMLGALVLAVVTVAGRPLPATSRAGAAMNGGPAVLVEESVTAIVIRPRDLDPDAVGLAFHPGALVDPRAYLPLLSQVAEAGHPVVLVKAPLGLALLSPDAAGVARDRMPQVPRWAIGGHSLGGAMASREFGGARMPAGLVLWASYPAESLTGADIPVLSVSGSRDGLAVPAEIEASRADVPEAAEFVVVDGANHAMFGDYGAQRGDRLATVGRAAGQAEIVAATAGFLDGLRGIDDR
ncbi:MAG: alpha/beta hydrolase [Dermatophilaceae bacterium]